MVELKPTIDILFPLGIGKAKEGIVLRIGHKMTIVKPDELRREAERLASDIEFERLKT